METNRRRQTGRVGAAFLVLGALALLVAPANAFIRIDDFRDPQTLVLPDGVTAVSGSATGPGMGAIPERDVVLRRLGETPGELTLTVDAGFSERLVVDDPFGVPAALSLVYDGLDGDEAIDPAGGDVDLTELGTEDRFALRLQADFGVDLRVQVFDRTDPSGNTWSAGVLAVPATALLRWVELPFLALDEMGPNGHADLRDVGAILFELTGPEGLGLQIDEIRVPEPDAGAAGLAALLALGALRRTLRPPRPRRVEFSLAR